MSERELTGATDPMLRDRAAGCLVGAALGDAFGMPLEFGPAINPPIREFRAGRIPAGSFTDDTEMMIALAESLLAHYPLDPADLAERFVDWYKRGPEDVGNQTRAILSQIQRGVRWDTASMEVQLRNPDSMPNGSVMRTFPVALAYWNDLPACLEESRLQSRVTHFHPECQEACAFVDAAIWHALHGATAHEAIDQALADTADKMPEALRATILAAPNQQRKNLRNTGWVRATVESAVWGLLATDSYTEAVIQVANLGADADTAAAVTGALAGAVYGLDAIPQDWQDILQGPWPLRDGPTWHTPNFIQMAHALLQRGS